MKRKIYHYKKLIQFTREQHRALMLLQDTYGYNVNNFIREAVQEKFDREWNKKGDVIRFKKYTPKHLRDKEE
jgi:hypothetical protein